ncbi:MAG: hypothetical protein ACKOWG_14920, partial [Planctomycetia bacterium]
MPFFHRAAAIGGRRVAQSHSTRGRPPRWLAACLIATGLVSASRPPADAEADEPAAAAPDGQPQEPAAIAVDADRVRPLPPVDPPQRTLFDQIRLAALGDPQDLQEPLMPDDLAPPGQPRQEFEPPAGRKLPPGAKPGILQQALYMATELPKLDPNGLGLTTLEKTITLGLPCPTVQSPLLVTTGFVGTLTDIPAGADIPGELFEGYIQARWLKKVTERVGIDLAVAPGWYSDFHNDSPQAMRITGHGFTAWEAHENLRVIAGLIYLDRYDVDFLPAGGLLWTPTDDMRCELIFPRPRLAWRIAERPRASHWLYLAAEFGGNQWAVQSVTGPTKGQDQILVIRDYRLLAGWERRPADLGLSWKCEAGWVTGRSVEYYLSNQPWLSPSDTFLVRA